MKNQLETYCKIIEFIYDTIIMTLFCQKMSTLSKIEDLCIP